MMRYVALSLLAALLATTSAFADQDQKYAGPLSASEKAFVDGVRADLMQRFPTAADAEKAGYVRYTNADSTGAISYANFHWTSANAHEPSQLWYDKSGKLMGADFSVPYTKGAARPKMFGVNPGRWYEFDDHVHYVLHDSATGKMEYDKYVMAPDFTKAGGDPAHPTADDLVKMHKVKSAADVSAVFDMPAIWDLVVWLRLNPKGEFHY